MKKYGVLVVDDSAVMRKAITAVIEQHEQLYVVGIARNGVDAIEKVHRLQPNVVTMDIEMPMMDGLNSLRQIMCEHPTAVVMLTNDVLEMDCATRFGAVDYCLKKNILEQPLEQEVELFHQVLIEAAELIMPEAVPIQEEVKIEVIPQRSDFEILMIGSSTGGPNALQQILPHIRPDFPVPIVIVQHMPVGFTKSLANRFNQLCEVPVKEVEHDEILKRGHIYIAPAGVHTIFKKNKDYHLVAQHEQESNVLTLYKPSIDVTLLSLVPLCKANVLAVILTGMGDDGLRGCKTVKEQGGQIISEHPDSCIIYGMPKVIYEANLCSKQVLIDDMFHAIVEILINNTIE